MQTESLIWSVFRLFEGLALLIFAIRHMLPNSIV
jgi:hypothetical protein